jgi:hypothetical protein
MTFAYAVEALTNDAKLWDGIADDLATVKSSVTNLDLAPGAFSFAGGEVATAYAALRERVLELLQDGTDQTRGAANALRKIRSDYENTEVSIQQSLAGLWEPEA